MRLDLEEDLWRSLRLYDGPGITPREWAERAIADGRIASEKQVIATLRKWRDVFDWGTSEMTGWRTTDVNPRLVRRRDQARRKVMRDANVLLRMSADASCRGESALALELTRIAAGMVARAESSQ